MTQLAMASSLALQAPHSTLLGHSAKQGCAILQADTYRRMRKATKGKWAAFCPATNALWLHYLADILLSCKANGWQPQATRSLRDFRCASPAFSSQQH